MSAVLPDVRRGEFFSRLPENELPYCRTLAREGIAAEMEAYRAAAKERALSEDELMKACKGMEYLSHIYDGLVSYQKDPAARIFTDAISAHMARRMRLPSGTPYETVAQKVWDDMVFGDAVRDDPELQAWIRVKGVNMDYERIFKIPMDYSGLVNPASASNG